MVDLDAITARLLRPARKNRRAVGAIYRVCEEALDGVVRPEVLQRWWLGTSARSDDELPAVAVAWEALASRDIIPMRWIDDPQRGFLRAPRGGFCERCLRGDCAHIGVTETARAPWSLRDCVVFASDPEGVTAAEALAEELSLARGGRPAPRVGWWTREADEVVRLRQDIEVRLRAGARLAPELALLSTGYAVHAVAHDAVELIAALV